MWQIRVKYSLISSKILNDGYNILKVLANIKSKEKGYNINVQKPT